MMYINIKNYVHRLHGVNLLDTVVEAVANSLHAGATNISITISYQDGTDSKKYIRSIEVSDDGAGFHIENQGSFNEFMSDYKLKVGGRGVGRFAYLKVFSIVKYESTYKGDDEFMHVGFVFDEKFEASYFRISKSMRKSTGTKLTLSGIKKKFDTTKQAARTPQDVKSYLLEKLLIEFSMNSSFVIDILSKDFDKEKICNRDIPIFEESKFTISREEITKEKMLIRADEEFSIKYFFKEGVPTKSYFCTERRTVKETGIKVRLNNEMGAVFLVFSPYLDKYVNDFRTNYEIPRDNIVTADIITQALQGKISDIVNAACPEINKKNQDILSELEKKYPYLKRYLSTEGCVGLVDDIEIVTKAINSRKKAKEHNISRQEYLEKKYHKRLLEQNIDHSLVEEFISHIEDTNEINKENLVEFVWYSDTILKFLLNFVDNNLCNESIIHNILIKKNEDYFRTEDAVQSEQNNMWIFGHQFMGYDYIASDKMITSILGSLDQEVVKDTFGDKKPDIFMVMPRENASFVSDVVLFELKKIGVSFFDKTKGITQIETYASALRKNIDSINMTWGFLVIDFDRQIEEHLSDNGFDKVYTENGFAYSRYYGPRKLLLTVLDMKSLLSMAKKRNEIFIEIMNGASPTRCRAASEINKPKIKG